MTAGTGVRRETVAARGTPDVGREAVREVAGAAVAAEHRGPVHVVRVVAPAQAVDLRGVGAGPEVAVAGGTVPGVAVGRVLVVGEGEAGDGDDDRERGQRCESSCAPRGDVNRRVVHDGLPTEQRRRPGTGIASGGAEVRPPRAGGKREENWSDSRLVSLG